MSVGLKHWMVMKSYCIYSFLALLCGISRTIGRQIKIVNDVNNPRNVSDFGYKIHGETPFVFHLKSCGDIHIALRGEDSSLCENKGQYYIVVGGWHNSKSTLECGSVVKTYRYYGLTKCDKYLPFWISWRGGNVAFGRGLKVGVGVFLSLVKSSPGPITEIVLKSIWGGVGHWLLEYPDSQWYSPVPLINVNITEDIIWTRNIGIQGACCIACHIDSKCVSVTFHQTRQICQGHNVSHANLNGISHHREVGTHYFRVNP